MISEMVVANHKLPIYNSKMDEIVSYFFSNQPALFFPIFIYLCLFRGEAPGHTSKQNTGLHTTVILISMYASTVYSQNILVMLQVSNLFLKYVSFEREGKGN